MRALLLSLTAFSLAACESIAPAPKPEPDTPKPVNGLSAQELGTGECGLFFWSKSTPRTFVFFQKQGETSAKYYGQGREIFLTTKTGIPLFTEASQIDIAYTSPEVDNINVKGSFSQIIEDGVRVPNGSISVIKPDGWQEITPVSGVYVCR